MRKADICTGRETHSLAQKPTCKRLGRNGQSPAIPPKATYAPVSNRPRSRSSSCLNLFWTSVTIIMKVH
ncbi:hypothetical protein BVJ53_03245 [Lacticaseibacillus chiayiensis]|uniref:Alpha-galactosidase n=1 Tax=Lacticaseibacillus chiayiensis TaxID=2100821 RepID=A0A4Q1UCG2_9LACO|nr:hypothetical protein BVJ53_03245 [Lacticaseibacillus chiayiensis]